MAPEPKKEAVLIRMGATEKTMLTELSDETGLSQSDVVRQLIRREHEGTMPRTFKRFLEKGKRALYDSGVKGFRVEPDDPDILTFALVSEKTGKATKGLGLDELVGRIGKLPGSKIAGLDQHGNFVWKKDLKKK